MGIQEHPSMEELKTAAIPFKAGGDAYTEVVVRRGA